MRKKTFITLLAVLVFFGLGVYYAIQAGYYPVAVVEGSFISTRRFTSAVVSADHYYNRALATINPTAASSAPVSLLEIRRATLDKLVEDELVYRELERQLGSEELAQLINGKISAFELANPDFEAAVKTLYNLSLDRFRELVLVPQARQELLVSRLTAKENEFAEWLTEARGAAGVIVLEPDLVWEAGAVVVR